MEEPMATTNELRTAILDAVPAAFTEENILGQHSLYIPSTHVKSIRLDSSIVVGSRGAGKSFWTQALGDATLKNYISETVSDLKRTRTAIGFSVANKPGDYPDGDFFDTATKHGYDFYTLWKAVVCRWLAKLTEQSIPSSTWGDSLAWVSNKPEQTAKLATDASNALSTSASHGLILFDALDRTSNDWTTMDAIVQALLRVVLWLRSYPSLHAKVFLRDDQLSSATTAFPDASKLLAMKTELIWLPQDLHGMLWQALLNAPGKSGMMIRTLYTNTLDTAPDKLNDFWGLPQQGKQNTDTLRILFEALAGRWMGTDQRRGVPFAWITNHLADGNGRVSPRTFLIAVKEAAEDSLAKHQDYPIALHFESIKRGVQRASKHRIDEVQEEYPWLADVFKPLAGRSVPIAFDEISLLWKQVFPDGPGMIISRRLPPKHADQGWLGLRDDLVKLGIFTVMRDARINIPDLYRIGFKIGRRGGIMREAIGKVIGI
jgi:hypothetical protein